MDVNEAREILTKVVPEEVSQIDYSEARGFIMGWDARGEELVETLKATAVLKDGTEFCWCGDAMNEKIPEKHWNFCEKARDALRKWEGKDA